MKIIDQNNALVSLETALHPGATLLDGRTERDWLALLCDFSSLINFYDNNNRQRGNWTPFLLKDPVLLLAFISKTRFEKYHSTYINTCSLLERAISNNEDEQNISAAFNHLFNQLIDVFMSIKRWVYYMQKSGDEYDLKKYVIGQVRNNYSKYFWAINSLRQTMFLSSFMKGLDAVDTSRFYFFDENDEKIWKENKNKSPYWEILNLQHPLKKNKILDIFISLQKAGDELFRFFHAVISHAPAEYDKIKTKRSPYPDTILLRAFVHLLKTQQEQLNRIAYRHLKFYYEDILKQQPLPAQADKVYLFAELAKKDAAVQLPAGTLFDAGMDTQKQQVLFTSTETVSLNPATITGAYTVAKSKNADGLYSLYLQPVANPALLQPAWNGFGTTSPANLVKLAIAFASPLLLLREGNRKISLSLYFDTVIDLRLLQQARYYLSTQQLWLEVQAVVSNIADDYAMLEIELDVQQPPIESFAKNPDGLNSSWPLLKIEFTVFPDLSTAPLLKRMDINVNVSSLKTFQLYNDFGGLSTKTPFQLFGPTPALNSTFIIGSNEIFSKPVDWLIVGLDWDQLPVDFADYYLQYNDYLDKDIRVYKRGKLIYIENDTKPTSWFGRQRSRIRRLFSKKNIPLPADARPFNNCAFKADFGLLQDQQWNKFEMVNAGSTVITKYLKPSPDNPKEYAETSYPKDLLFTISGTDRHLQASSYFSYGGGNIFHPDASIQNTPLKFTDASASGFMKLVLSGPQYGFGAEVYPAVVNYVALQNAHVITLRKRKPTFVLPPNLPFAPKVKALTANYSASQSCDFTQTATAYPIQCYLYSPFTNYKIYDSEGPVADYNYTLQNNAGNADQHTGVPLFHSFKYDGCLFLQTENLVTPNDLNLYFELSGRSGGSVANNPIDYFYLSNKGWQTLPVVADGTNNFRCSGLIKVNIGDDATTQSLVMPAGKYWLTIATIGKASSFPKISMVKTNGFMAERTSSVAGYVSEAPELLSASIAKPQAAIPSIAAITQPFASFDGKAAESEEMMHRRVSSLVKTKDRAVSAEDFTSLIRQHFSEIYHSSASFNKNTKNIEVYVVKAYKNELQPEAFFPLVSTCTEVKIRQFLTERTSAFYNISVSNFKLFRVRVTASIKIKPGFEQYAIQLKLNQALNIFLSPWITNDSPQVSIGQPITEAQVATLIKGIEGVEQVSSVKFQTMDADAPVEEIENSPYESSITPSANSVLFISYMNHVFNTSN